MTFEFPHQFSNTKLKECALDSAHPEFERLEWLGDRVLGCSVALALHQSHPGRQEADLSRAFGHLVNNKRLTRIAVELEIPGYDIAENSSRLADKVEAILGAVMLDAGFDQVHACVEKLFQGEMSDPAAELWEKDPKSRLKEICEARQKQQPRYIYSQDGQEFESECFALDLNATGKGATKNEAASMAASKLLAELDSMGK